MSYWKMSAGTYCKIKKIEILGFIKHTRTYTIQDNYGRDNAWKFPPKYRKFLPKNFMSVENTRFEISK